MKLQDLMSSEVLVIATTAKLEEALEKMRVNAVHHLVATNDGRVAGVLSEGDIHRIRAINNEFTWTVDDAMTVDIVTADPRTTVKEAAALMRGRAIGSLPIVRDGVLVGVVTTADLLDYLARPPKHAAADQATSRR